MIFWLILMFLCSIPNKFTSSVPSNWAGENSNHLLATTKNHTAGPMPCHLRATIFVAAQNDSGQSPPSPSRCWMAAHPAFQGSEFFGRLEGGGWTKSKHRFPKENPKHKLTATISFIKWSWSHQRGMYFPPFFYRVGGTFHRHHWPFTSVFSGKPRQLVELTLEITTAELHLEEPGDVLNGGKITTIQTLYVFVRKR